MREKLQVAIRSVFRVLVSPLFFFFKENLGSFSLLYYFCYYYLTMSVEKNMKLVPEVLALYMWNPAFKEVEAQRNTGSS